MMECDLCRHPFTSQKKPTCVSCTATLLYDPRLHLAQALLAREKAHNHVEALLRPGNDGILAAISEDTDLETITAETQRQTIAQAKVQQEVLHQRADEIEARIKDLRQEIREFKEHIALRKNQVVVRQKALASARARPDTEKQVALSPITTAIGKTKQRISRVSSRTAEARAFLCHQVAMLLGLKRIRLGDQMASEYWLAGSPIVNLRHICKIAGPAEKGTSTKSHATRLAQLFASHEMLTASLENVCRLLTLCCHYLSARLPAELIVPTREAVHFAVLPERSAYKNRETPSSVSHMKLSTASLLRSTAERMNALSHSRMRMVYLDRTLQTLSNDDPKAFLLYIETIMLLAWDIAWLCRTQGIDSINSFEDVCSMGRNLFTLFMRSDSQTRRTSGLPSTTPSETGSITNVPLINDILMGARFGVFSNASVSHPIHGVAGQELLQGWRLGSSSSVTWLADKLANHLTSEMSRQEWDTIGDDEWDEPREDEQAVLVGGEKRTTWDASAGLGTAMSVMTISTVGHGNERDRGPATGARAARGKSGWTKVRGRVES